MWSAVQDAIDVRKTKRHTLQARRGKLSDATDVVGGGVCGTEAFIGLHWQE